MQYKILVIALFFLFSCTNKNFPRRIELLASLYPFESWEHIEQDTAKKILVANLRKYHLYRTDILQTITINNINYNYVIANIEAAQFDKIGRINQNQEKQAIIFTLRYETIKKLNLDTFFCNYNSMYMPDITPFYGAYDLPNTILYGSAFYYQKGKAKQIDNFKYKVIKKGDKIRFARRYWKVDSLEYHNYKLDRSNVDLTPIRDKESTESIDFTWQDRMLYKVILVR